MDLLRASSTLVQDAIRTLGWRVPFLFVLTLASAILEGGTLALLLPLLTVLGFSGSLDSPDRVTSAVLALFAAWGQPFTAPRIGVLLLGLIVLSAGLAVLQAYYSTSLQARYVAQANKRLFATILASRWDVLRRSSTGSILSSLTKDADNLGEAFNQGNFVASSLVFMAVQVTVATLIQPLVTPFVMVLTIVLFFATRGLIRRGVTLSHELLKTWANRQSTVQELLAAAKFIKATGSESEATRAFGAGEDRIAALGAATYFDIQIARAIFEYSSAAIVALLLIVGPLYLGIEIGVIIVVLAIFIRLFPRVTALRRSIQALSLALPSVERVERMRLEAEAARETELDDAANANAAAPAGIQFRDVTVLGEEGRSLLSNIDLSVKPGAFVSIVGPTGGGKTTLVDCILGLAMPASGEVLLDGVPSTRGGLGAWRRSAGYLGQEPVLFAGSIRDNVTWGRAGFDDAAVAAALGEAAADFVLRLPAGLDTILGERGGSLSGGERQRIALARAMLGHPRLIILDEATSALDGETERLVIDALLARRGRITIVTITHRIEAAAQADLVVVLENGCILESGAFSELMEARGRFAALWLAQGDARVTSEGNAKRETVEAPTAGGRADDGAHILRGAKG
jgi:ATP-binding cassette subfamily C protein